MIPKTATVEELLPIFTKYGEIEELSILKGPDGLSKGILLHITLTTSHKLHVIQP